VTGLGYDKTSVVAHDIGNTVAYGTLPMYPQGWRLVVLDARSGIEPWMRFSWIQELAFNFHGPDANGLVAGLSVIYLDRI